MAKSLDELIGHLLEEIALTGEQGATFRTVVGYARRFYAKPDWKDLPPKEPQTTFTIDRGFVSKLWKWLAQHEDVTIGFANENWKSLAYDGVEKQHPGITELILSDRILPDEDETGESSDALGEALEVITGGPRFFTNSTRIWAAICGHGPDAARVFPTEFDILSVVATRRYAGILQGELRRLTGQDKRSVPKRTDILEQKGYIVKRTVWTSGHKTSRIFLTRFANADSASSGKDSKAYIVRDFAKQIFTALQGESFTSLDGLANKTSNIDPARRRLLHIVVKHFIVKGCLKRISVVSGQGKQAASQICVQVLRWPDDADFDSGSTDKIDLDICFEDALEACRQFLLDIKDDEAESHEVINLEDEMDVQEETANTSKGYLRPQWNPHRVVPNALFDLTHNSGETGVTHISLREAFTGLTVRRPIEALLVRVAHASLRSQPESVRDLSIVRSWEVLDSQGRYVHRTFDQFQSLALKDQQDWAGVEGGKALKDSLKEYLPFQSSLNHQRDNFGFVKRVSPKEQFPLHQRSLEEAASSCKSIPMPLRRNEPILQQEESKKLRIDKQLADMQLPDTVQSIDIEQDILTPRKYTRKFTPTEKSETSKKPTPAKEEKIGRPRKFPRGAEKFWRDMFIIKYREDNPEEQHKKPLGLGKDEGCLQLLHNRPYEFDDIILRAMELGLPLPCATKDVSQAWVDKMKIFLSRRGIGAFHAPSGMRKHSLAAKSCILVVRSPRLRGGWPPPAVMFLSSSKAHTSRVYHVHFETEDKTTSNGTATEDSVTVPRVTTKPKKTQPTRYAQSKTKVDKALSEGKKTASHEANLSVLVPTATRQTDTYHSVTLSEKRDVEPPIHSAFDEARESSTIDLESITTPSAGVGASLSSNSFSPQDATLLQARTTLAADSRSMSAPQITDQAPSEMAAPPGISALTAFDNLPEHKRQKSPIHHTGTNEIGIAQAKVRLSSQMMPSPPRSTGTPPISNDHLPALAHENEISHVEPNISKTADKGGDDVLSQAHGNSVHKSQEPPGNDANTHSPAVEQFDPHKRTNILHGRDAVLYYRLFICELVNLAGGMVPYSPPTLKRALRFKCLETDCDPDPNIKLMKTGTSILVRAGKLKLIHFAYQRKGFNHTKSILALPSIDTNDPQLKALQAKLASLPYEEEYIQPELIAEIDRRPPSAKRRVIECEPNTTPLTPRKKNKAARVRRELSTLSQSPSPSPTPEPPSVTANTGFLTLKVPRISEVKTREPFTTHYYGLQSRSLAQDHDIDSSVAQNGMVKWLKSTVVPLPKSFRAIMQQERTNSIHEQADSYEDSASSAFVRNVDIVSDWERRNMAYLEAQVGGPWNFINHLTPANIGPVRWVKGPTTEFRLVGYINDEEVERDAPPVVSWKAFASIPPTKKTPGKKRKRKEETFEDIDAEADHEISASEVSESENRPKKRKRQSAVADQKAIKPKKAVQAGTSRRPKGKLKPRGIGMRHLPEDQALRLGVVLTVIRTLLGGIDRHVNFELAEKFMPGETAASLRERFKRMSSAYGSDMEALSDDFQSKYLGALADEQVPSVDYDNLDQTDWAGIIDWAVRNISTTRKDVLRELPPTREEFLALHKTEIVDVSSVRSLYNHALFFTMGAREDAWCSTTFGSVMPVTRPTIECVKHYHLSEQFQQDAVQAVARSWIVSMLMTPQQKYNAKRAHKKLMTLTAEKARTEQLLSDATRQLQVDKVIMRIEGGVSLGPDGTPLADSRGYRMSSRFFDRFESNRSITTQMLLDACRYKLAVLDPAARAGQKVSVPRDVNLADGAIMAIFNLISMDMLRILPGDDVPASRYGLDWEREGYKTRSMDKSLLCFSTVLDTTSQYVLGDPLEAAKTSLAVPRGEIDQQDSPNIIPMWFDINLEFQPAIWEMVAGTVIGVISMRPGVSTIETIRTLNWAVSMHDMDLVLDYLFKCGCVQKVYDGWETTKWWWLALGVGHSASVQKVHASGDAGIEGMTLVDGTIDD